MFAVCENNKIIHFIGLGGIGVSGLAEILHSLGYIVKGSDRSYSQNLERLEKLGIQVFIGHDQKNVGNADVVVYSSAIKDDNPEILYAKSHKIPVLSRAEMLSQIVRFKKSVVVAGSHGKTTVTSLCASLLEMSSFYPTIVNGGVINSYQTNAKLGKGDWAVIESDESDGSFVEFFPYIGIITNIDHEHINHYGSFENLKLAFKKFIKNLPFYGCGIVCIDDENVCDIIKDTLDRRIITYSIEKEDAMFRASNIRKFDDTTKFDVMLNNELYIKDVEVPILGDHNIKNTLASIAMSFELNISEDTIKSTLKNFQGVNRRFTKIGKINGIQIIDDYAHHPTEIRSVLNAAKQYKSDGKIVAICQPHRFTRLNNLFDGFVNSLAISDIVAIAPVYKADDKDSGKISSQDLFDAIKEIKKEDAFYVENEEDIEYFIKDLINTHKICDKDVILFLGAGNISRWARNIVERIGDR